MERPHLAKKKVLFHEDNVPSYLSIVEMDKIKEFKFELFSRPQYPPDLVPSNFYLFPNVKITSVEQNLVTTLK